MERDVTCTKFYKNIALQLSLLNNKYLPFENESTKGESHFEISRKRFIDAYILNEIISAVLSCEVSYDKYGNEDESQVKILEDLKNCLSLINLECYLHPFKNNSNPDSKNEDLVKEKPLTLLNINNTTLSKNIKNFITFRHKEFLKEKISEWFSCQGNKIISFTFPNDVFGRPSKGLALVVDRVAELKLTSQEGRIAIEKQKKYNSSLLKLVHKQLTEYGNGLEWLVQKFRMSSHPLPHLTQTLFSMDVYLLKFRCLELEVLASTYTPYSVTRLKNTNKALTREHEHVNSSLMEVEHKLLAYRDLNPRFHQLLREYANLQKDLKLLKEKELK